MSVQHLAPAVILCAAVVLFTGTAHAQEAAAPASIDAELNVVVKASYREHPGEVLAAYEADVRIDGAVVGKTPFRGSLPPGQHYVEVEAGGMRASLVVAAEIGRTYNVTARFSVPMPEEEKLHRLAEARAEKEAADRVEGEEWSRALTTWQEKDDEARAKRKPYIIAGTTLMIGGAGLMIAGTALAVRARRENEEMLNHESAWRQATDDAVIANEKNAMDDAASARNLHNGIGVAFLIVGGASIATSIVVLAVMPKRPAALVRGEIDGPALSVTPLVGPEIAGLSVEMRF